ncbi:MAG: hypothetical protein M0031_00410 [Thermaerobacter sp.]|nr:hypothetical protein [Thermaerobacter sp.]
MAVRSDTSPEVASRYQELLMAKNGQERMLLGAAMYAQARKIVEASVREHDPDASDREVRRQVFLRFYGGDFDAKTLRAILVRLGLS